MNSETPRTDKWEFEQECNFDVAWEENCRQLERELAAKEKELAELRADKERLDWFERETKERCVTLFGTPKSGLIQDDDFSIHLNGLGYIRSALTVRSAIDQAMKGQNEC